MNYLAHSILSFSDGQLVGNMIADFIRNHERDNYPSEIRNGIKLHRFIDSFTDSHPSVHEAKKLFSPLVRLYSGAFVDVAFDYFVAHRYSEKELKEKSSKTYETLWNNKAYLPENFQRMLTRMEADDWLTNYRQDWGIQFSMQNVLNKAKYLDKDLPVYAIFLENKSALQMCFDVFFPDLEMACKNEFRPKKM